MKKPAPIEVKNLTIPIDALVPHERNYRAHPDAQLERLEASLRRFTQYRSIVVQEQSGGRYRIVAGHGLVEAAKREHLAELRADVLPASMSEEDILGILVADNLTAQSAEDDLEALAALLQEQADAGYHLETLGSSQEELDKLLEELAQETLDHSRTTELNEPEGGEVQSAYSVLVECQSEAEQQRAYDLLTGEGFTCRVLTL